MELGRMAALGSLAAGLSHELNNPVAFVQSNLGSLSRYVDKITEYTAYVASGESLESPDQALAFIRRLPQLRRQLKLDFILEDLPQLILQSQDGMKKVQKTVADLRRFTRADDQVGTIEINEVVDSLLAILRNEYKYKAAVQTKYGTLPLVRGAPTRLGQLLLNVLLNACRSIPDDGSGQIQIETCAPEGKGLVRVEIRDDGRPLSEESVGRLGLDFQAMGPDQDRELRLHQACMLAKELGGEIRIVSGAEGNTVTVELPSS
jgi:two-component system NtrC family sensor kinase